MKMEEKKTQWETIEITEEEISRQLDEREGAWKAGRGDSPYTQEFYEELWGIKKEEDRPCRYHDSPLFTVTPLCDLFFHI